MDTLSTLLSSRVRAEIFRLLFGLDAGELHLREIERRSGLSVGTVRQDVAKLVRLDLVEARRAGNRVYYRANRQHPFYPDINRLVLKSSGLADVLRARLGTKGIRCAFVFGSLASGTGAATSDVDLFVVGSVSLRELSRRLGGLTEELGRDINPFALRASEFRERVRTKEHFVSRVLESPKLFVVGGEDELAGMG
jgi:predicted nucleotidyltransferase